MNLHFQAAKINIGKGLILLCSIVFASTLISQTSYQGVVTDDSTGEPLIGASVIIENTTDGAQTDWDGTFFFKSELAPPIKLVISYIGFEEKIIFIKKSKGIKIQLEESSIKINTIEVKGQRISEKQKSSPLTVETLDLIAIRETPASNFYDGLGALKDVDLTTASLGFTVINTRGFNSTSPVRSLQIIDGVDNQSPGLNFSLGNFLGANELDLNSVEIIVGASSAFYGPNAFNGVISMKTKDPFYSKGLSASIKGAERNLIDAGVRYADVIKNEEGDDFMAYKFNLFYLRADDWVADNINPVDGTTSAFGNPGGWDAVNSYGDEYFSLNDFSHENNLSQGTAGLGLFHRNGYKESDLVDYDTRNLKANIGLHFRLQPDKKHESPELILASSYGNGTTVYQGDNRFSLKGISFYQNRIELRKKNKYFLRAYSTNEDSGDSYDPYFTALRLNELAKKDELWAQNYINIWQGDFKKRMIAQGYPEIEFRMGIFKFDRQEAINWINNNQDSLNHWHSLARNLANKKDILNNETNDFFIPGTERFQSAFDSITSLKNNEGGTRFFDKSALYHIHGEYTFSFDWLDKLTIGSNARIYRPNSEGTVFIDTFERITNKEVGFYTGFQKKIGSAFTWNGTLRMDKNENFPFIFTPASSLIWAPDNNNYLRVSFSSGVRNPTLSDQYLNLNVGRATLLGNLNGFKHLATVESFKIYRESLNPDDLEYFDIAPVKPERVKTLEFGYRTTLLKKIYLDLGYYYNVYTDFLGYNIGLDIELNEFGFPSKLDAYRISANSINTVSTQGFSVGSNYYFGDYFTVAGNFSWNKLNVTFPDDPIIPAFNTPEKKYNIGLSGRNIPVRIGIKAIKKMGFNFNYKWVEGFTFEGSPQFTGEIPSYGLLDGQINFILPRHHLTIKLGSSNILNNKVFQTYGGPRIGRLAYLSITYNFEKK